MSKTQFKSLSLAHLELGAKEFSGTEDPSFCRIVAFYLASPQELYQYQTDKTVIDKYIAQAMELPYEEGAEIVSFFTEASQRFLDTINRKATEALTKKQK